MGAEERGHVSVGGGRAGRQRPVAPALQLAAELLAAHAAACDDQAHLAGAGERRGPRDDRPRLHPHDGYGDEPRPRRIEAVEGRLERCQDDELAAVLLDEIGSHARHPVADDGPGPAGVRSPRLVCQVDDVLVGQRPLDRVGRGESRPVGSEDADGRLGVHGTMVRPRAVRRWNGW